MAQDVDSKSVTTQSAALASWVPWVGCLLSLAGVGVTIYLTIAHYTTSVVLACPDRGIVNCAKVTTSSYSEILGVPVALLGLIFFVVMLGLQLPVMWRQSHWLIRWGRLALATSGVLMVFYLIYVELFRLNAICLYCSAVHVLTILVFGLTATGTALTAVDG